MTNGTYIKSLFFYLDQFMKGYCGLKINDCLIFDHYCYEARKKNKSTLLYLLNFHHHDRIYFSFSLFIYFDELFTKRNLCAEYGE